MFGQLKNSRNHESGMVLLTVLMIVAVLMILSIAILSHSVTKNASSQGQVDQIRADEFAKGVFWNAHSSGSFTPGTTVLGTYGGRTYSSTVTTLGTLANVQISY